MEGATNYTLTVCGVCLETSEVDEGMVGCDCCNCWYHYRCVGVTEAIKAEKFWFCATDTCQQQCRDQKKQEEANAVKKANRSKKTLATDESSDKSSVKSVRQSGSSLERKLKALEEEQKAKEKEMKIERIIRERRLEMDRSLKEQKLKIEMDLRAQEMEQERELLQMALQEEQAHLNRMKLMRKSFQSQMENVQQELNAHKAAGEGEGKRNTGAVKKNAANPYKLVVPPKTVVNGQKTPLRNPNVSIHKLSRKKEEQGQCGDKIKYGKFKEQGNSDYSEEEDDDEQSVCSNTEQSFGDDSDESEDENGHPTTIPDGLGQSRTGPTRAQLAARNGITKKLPIFTGRPEEWPLFIGSYQASNEACGFSDVENLVRLQESIKGNALEIVRGQLLLPKSVPKVISKLRQLFGRPEQLLQCHLEKVRRLEAPKAEKLATFIPFGNAVEQLCDHLEAAELTQHLLNPLLIQELVDKLPANDKREWVRYKKRKRTASLRTFTNFLSRIVSEACEANVSVEYKTDARPSNSNRSRFKEKGGVLNHITPEVPNTSTPVIVTQKPCKVCNRADHRLRFCQDFKNLAFADRMKVVDKWKLCKTCLNDHGNAPCKFKIRCNVGECRERHNPLLHPVSQPVAINAHLQMSNTILFRMLPIKLHCGEKSVTTLAFLDEGASVTLVEKSLADFLGVEGVKERLTIKWTADITRVEAESRRINLWISTKGTEEKMLLTTVHTVGEMMLPKQSLNVSDIAEHYQYLRGLPIAPYSSGRPGVLIGLNNLHTIAPIESKIGGPGEPIAVRCKLGWTVYGPNKGFSANSESFLGHHHGISNQDLHDVLKKHYALEESAVGVQQESKDDKRAREILERTTIRVGDRFETGLLWKNDDPQFPNSFPMALRRLKHLEQRLAKNPELYQIVKTQIQEYQQKGYAHLASQEELACTDPCKAWYLPLNVVLNPKKPGKVRLVWDAAATVNGVSLHSQLLKGPDMLASLPAVISRFRERRVAFGGDIREMYHQLQIRTADKQSQRFLFRTNPEKPPDVYVMDVATFGSTCSPCSAQFVKNRNAVEYSTKYPEAAAAIVDKHYVDDYFDSVDTIEDAVRRANEVRYIHSKAGFELRNWVSNSDKVLLSVGEPKPVQTIHFNLDKTTENERVLGIIWNPSHDEFSFSTKHREDLKPFLGGDHVPTKRIVLSCVMGFFDPLGLLAPYTVHGRMLVQDLWRTGCEWDEPVDDKSLAKWKRWTNLLPEVEEIRIPRCHLGNFHSSDIESLELHIFTDASEHAYGCVAYFRVVSGDHVWCSLVMSRSKVAPLKQQSIPRLELMAAVLGAKLSHTIKANHSLPITRCLLWTDSEVFLSWMRSDQRNYKIFVGLRIEEIRELTNLTDWRWVPTKLNIADVLTKWGQGPPLDSDGSWFNGPRFLYEPEVNWPAQRLPAKDTTEEIKACLLYHDVSISKPVINVCRVSRWIRLQRITASVCRFISNCRRKKLGLPIETTEATKKHERMLKAKVNAVQKPFQQEDFQKAETILWRQAQHEGFTDEVRTLTKNQKRNPQQHIVKLDKSSILYKLTPILDTEGVIRLGGRMEQATDIPFDKKFPIILPKEHEITKRLLQHYHEKFGHANRETVFNELRQKFYVAKFRSAIGKVMTECVWCKVHRCQPHVPLMAPLPVQRITPHLRPFSSVGVDYLGPVEVSVNRRREKRWVVVFTCLAIRAVHLDIVHKVSTQSCLMAIRRFICKRGAPEEIFSDNGTCFKGASKEMKQERKQIGIECAESITSATTKWNFNPPGTPHMGGIWERMVRSVKQAITALDDGQTLTDEILLTTLSEAEDMINSRPLTYVPQESADAEAITPNHFLRGSVKYADRMVEGPIEEAEALRDLYKRSQYLADKMWERWYKEYLPTINQRTKWFEEQKSLQNGDLVFIVDGKNRKQWTRGIVQEVIVSSDGRIRQANVRIADGRVFRRGVVNLAVLEIRSNSGSSGGIAPELRAGDVLTPQGTVGPNACLPSDNDLNVAGSSDNTAKGGRRQIKTKTKY